MNLPFQITFNSVLMILIGIGLIVFGIWLTTYPGLRISGGGFVSTGIGNLILGFTNGFTDMTPIGRTLFKFALAAYFIGIPIILYYLYTEVSFG